MRKFFLGLFLLPVAAAGLCAKTPPSASRVETYRYASQLAPSAAYAVKVNGEDPSVLFFETGKVHPAGKIQLRQGQRLYIEGGAVVDGYVSASRLKGVSLDGFGILNAVPYTKEPNGIGILECGDVRVANLITCNTSSRNTISETV